MKRQLIFRFSSAKTCAGFPFVFQHALTLTFESDWNDPCILYPLQTDDLDQKNFWKAPAPLGPGPFGDGNYTIGSWGPGQGISTYWQDSKGNSSGPVVFPGTGRVDGYWGRNIWTFTAQVSNRALSASTTAF